MLQDGVARHLHIALGTSVIVIGLALIVLAAALRVPPGPGTLVVPLLGGITLNELLPHLPELHGVPLRFAAVIVATLMMGLSGAVMIRTSVGVAAYDGVMLGLQPMLGKPLGTTRLAMEATVFVAGWLLGGSVGVGTALTGLLIGPAIQFCLRAIDMADRSTPEEREGSANSTRRARTAGAE